MVMMSEKDKKELNQKIQEISDYYYGVEREEEAIQSLRELSLEYMEEDIAKCCFEFDYDQSLLTSFLGIAGNNKVEKYLRLLMKKNSSNDNLVSCATGLAGLNIDEGFEILEKLASKIHVRSESVYYVFYDVYSFLEPVDNPRANQLKEDIRNGKYGKFGNN